MKAFCRDHPRLRGENPGLSLGPPGRRGSPPLARGKPQIAAKLCHPAGITPACAGKTRSTDLRGANIEDHPRLRGENKNEVDEAKAMAGSPPLARGKLSTIVDR